MMDRLTKEQAAVITAYTGILCGNFSDFHEYAEKILNRPIWTHEFGDKKMSNLLKEASEDDFMSLVSE